MPSPQPSANPTVTDSESPSASPSATPSAAPSPSPSESPSNEPSVVRSMMPSITASASPTLVASGMPSLVASGMPSITASASPSGVPSSSPSGNPSNSPSILMSFMPSATPTGTPTGSPTPAPTNPPTVADTLMPTEAQLKCVFDDAMDETCSCDPYRSPDSCPVDESFTTYVMKRTRLYKREPQTLTDAGFWFHELEDKTAAKYFLNQLYVSHPMTYCCETDVEELKKCILNMILYVIPDKRGFVVKASSEHSNTAVYPLSKNGEDGYINLLNGEEYTVQMVLDELTMLEGTNKFIVEELVDNQLPLEVKFHVFKGEIGAIELISGRGTDCPCFATIDTNGERLDECGCFEPSGTELGEFGKDSCVNIDFDGGLKNAGKIKGDLGLCIDLPDIAPCLLEQMINAAQVIGTKIGAYIRVDMFVTNPSSAENGLYYIQEFSANPMNGLRHCAAQIDEAGCVDPCFLGRMWATAGSMTGPGSELNLQVGGMPVAPPTNTSGILGFGNQTPQQMCDAIKGYPKQKPWSCEFGKFTNALGGGGLV